MKQLTLAIPTYNRFDMVLECVADVIKDPRITEIVVCDDASTNGSYEMLQEWSAAQPKVKLFRNEKNLDCYGNKAQTLRHATNEWAILFDSDNVIRTDYLDRLFEHFPWHPDFTYLPVFARPSFDYTLFEGATIDRQNVASFMGHDNFRCALNTANCFVHRQTYLDVWDPDVNPHTADSIYMNYRLLAAGKILFFVAGLCYFHRVHEQSHYKQNCHLTGKFIDQVEKKLRDLR